LSSNLRFFPYPCEKSRGVDQQLPRGGYNTVVTLARDRDPEALLAVIPNTKTQILTHLKRMGGASVDELASALQLASMTVRQHLSNLERDGLVDCSEVRRSTGRPYLYYRITEKGEQAFPRRYDRLATLLLQEFCEINPYLLVGLSGEQRTRVAMSRLADRLAHGYAPRVRGRTLAERVEIVTEILQQESGFAEWRRTDNGYEIRDLNCPYRRVTGCDDQACDWHRQFIAQLLDCEIEPAPDACNGVECCRYVVLDRAPFAEAAS